MGVIRYSVGNEHNPADPWGRSELVIEADGTARLDHHFSRKPEVGTWTGRVDPRVLDSLWSALDQVGVPEVPIPPDAAVRKLVVETDGIAREVFVGWHAADAEAFHLIDEIIRQLNPGGSA